jgi:hypothetical protein
MMNRRDDAEAAYEEARKARAKFLKRDLDFSCANVLGYPFLKMVMARGSVEEQKRFCSVAAEFVKLDNWHEIKADVVFEGKEPCRALK